MYLCATIPGTRVDQEFVLNGITLMLERRNLSMTSAINKCQSDFLQRTRVGESANSILTDKSLRLLIQISRGRE